MKRWRNAVIPACGWGLKRTNPRGRSCLTYAFVSRETAEKLAQRCNEYEKRFPAPTKFEAVPVKLVVDVAPMKKPRKTTGKSRTTMEIAKIADATKASPNLAKNRKR